MAEMPGASHQEVEDAQRGVGGRPVRPVGPTLAGAIVVSSAVVVSVLAGVALLGWSLGLRRLAGLGSSTVPMSPSTALLLLAHGLVLGLRARPVLGRRATVAGAAVGVGAAAVALVLIVLSSLGIRLPIEHFGMSLPGAVGAPQAGHMSPVTAACFLLASLAVVLMSRPAPGVRSMRRLVSFGAASLLLATSLVFLLAYLYDTPLLSGSGVNQPAVNTTFALAALGIGLLAATGRRARASGEPEQGTRPSGWLLLVFALLAAGMVGTGQFYYRGQERHYRAEVERQLSAVADLKTSELTEWRRERIGDGSVFLHNDAFAELVERCALNPDDQRWRERLAIWLRRVRESYQYDRVFVLDARGDEVASAPATPEPVAPHLRSSLPESLRARQAAFLDFHRDGPGLAIHLSIVVPLRAEQERKPVGILVLRIDPTVRLYSMIQRWPTLSRTAETLLVRREGEEVLYLNELRFRKGTALSLRVPLSDERLPAAKAVRGQRGSVEGVDYRGVDVIAALRSVPGSPWFLVARVDAAEVLAPQTERLWLTLLFVVVMLFGSGAVLGLVWRRQSTRFYREKYEAGEALRAIDSELRQRNDELTRFTYTVSHDLKSPLVTIQTFLGYLGQDLAAQDATGVEKDLGFIRTAAQKMSRLLDDLLELSRVGRKMNPPEEVPLRTVVEDALALVAGRLATRGARVEITNEPVMLHGDRVRLVEIFENLVDNAVKFMGPQASPLVEVGVERRAEELVLFVRDNGAGIDPRHTAKLFGLFEKLDPKSEGTGVGLALVRRIVEAHGGRIWLESEGAGRGACFRFTLAGTRCAPPEGLS